jgi:glycosyltransferase involved in cell wall biosynthesis
VLANGSLQEKGVQGEDLKNPRILVLSTCYPSREDDPAGVFIAKLMVALKKKGYDVTVIAPSDGTFFGSNSLFGLKSFRFGYFMPRSMLRLTRVGGGIPENLANSRLAKLQVIPMMAVFLVTALKEARRNDLVYANWIGAGLVGAFVNLILGKPLVISPLGDDGYLARDHRLWRSLTKWVCSRSSIVAPNSSELIQILSDLGVPEQKLHFYHLGVDSEMFHPALHPPPDDQEIRVTFVGSLIDRKGPHDLIAALQEPTLSRVKLVMVGDGSRRKKLEDMAAGLGLTERITWTGMVSPRVESDILRDSHVFCLPSYMEGTPNVIYEAMATGLPVVSTRVGGIPEQVRHGETGLLFRPGNIQELRDCLRRLVQDAELRTRMGKTGYTRIIEAGVSWDAAAEDFDRIFSYVRAASTSEAK